MQIAFAKYIMKVSNEIELKLESIQINEEDIKITPKEWTNGNVTITINTNKSGEVYYKVNESGEWKKYEKNFEVEENCKIYAKIKYTDGESPETVKEVTNIDKIKPTVEIQDKSEYTTSNIVTKLDGTENTNNGHSTSTTTWNDISGNKKNGTITDGTWGENYLQFNGTTTWVNLGVMNSNYQTLEATFSPDSTNTGYIVGNWEVGGGGIMIQNGNLGGEFYIGNQYYTVFAKEKVVAGNIYNAIVTFDGNTLIFYVNGIEQARKTVSGTIGAPVNSTVMSVGSNPSSNTIGGNIFKGKIYNVAVYNQALTSDEAKLNAQGSLLQATEKYTILVGKTTTNISKKLIANDEGGSGLKTLSYAYSQSNTTEPTTYEEFKNEATVTKSATGGNWYIWTKVLDNAGNRAEETKISPGYNVGYQISYDTNGGTGAPVDQRKVHGTELKISETIPTRTGYWFKGWATASTATTAEFQVGENYTVDKATILYAVWGEYSTITYSTNMQMTEIAQSNGWTVKKTVKDNEEMWNATLTKTSGTSSGWAYIDFPTYEYEENVTYRIRLKVRVNSVKNIDYINVRNSAISNDYWTDGHKVQNIGLTTGQWNEYVLDRQFKSSYSNSAGTKITTSPRIEIWTSDLKLTNAITSRSIDMDIKDVYVEKITTQSKNYNEELGTLTKPTRTGYTFDGWYTERVGGTKITSATKVPEGDVTYYAHWNAIEYLSNKVQIGDYVNYDASSGNGANKKYTTSEDLTGSSTTSTFNSSDNIKWRVLSVNKTDGTVTLMGAEPTEQSITFENKKGYINADKVLNKVGDVYGHGKGAASGRSITKEDIEQYSSWDKKSYINGSSYVYGSTQTYTSGTFIKDGNEITATSSNPVTETQTAYLYREPKNYYSNETAYNMLYKKVEDVTVNKEPYWIASYSVSIGKSYCHYHIGRIEGGMFNLDNGRPIYESTGKYFSVSCRAMPVVTLRANLQTTGKDNSGAWNLKYDLIDDIDVGSTINYSPSGTYSLDKSYATSNEIGTQTLNSASGQSFNVSKWKVLSIDKSTGKIEMVPATTPSGTVKLQGAQGYNNAVKLLNDACSNLYGNSGKGITARSITEEDFVKVGGTKWKNKRASYVNYAKYGDQYGTPYTTNNSYPTMYKNEANHVIGGTKTESGLKQSEQSSLIAKTDEKATNGYLKAITSIQPYQTFYSTTDYATTAGLLEEYSNILLPNGNSTTYWVASRCVYLDSSYSYFNVRNVYSGYFNASIMFSSGTGVLSYSRTVFPVVSLSSQLLEKTTDGTYNVK